MEPSHDLAASYQPPALVSRLLANIVDGLVVALPLGLVLAFLPAFAGNLVAEAGYALYVVVMLSSKGATIGKRLFGIRVAMSPDGSGKPTQLQALKRECAQTASPLALLGFLDVVDAFISLWALAMVISVLGSPIKRGVYDRFAGTWVIDAKTHPA